MCFSTEFRKLLEINHYKCKQVGFEKRNSKHFRDLILISYKKVFDPSPEVNMIAVP